MFNNYKFSEDKKKSYSELIEVTNALISVENNKQANLANIISMLNYFLDDINWVGFYFIEKETTDLVLSHFNGLPACTRIKKGKGVCGKVYETSETIVVEDVDNFEDHIACDSNSKSEIVIPITFNDTIYGVLDIDSPIKSRFDDIDAEMLSLFVKSVIEGQLDG